MKKNSSQWLWKHQGRFVANSTYVWLFPSPSTRSHLEVLYLDDSVSNRIIMFSRFIYYLPRALLCYLQNNSKMKGNPWSMRKALPLNCSYGCHPELVIQSKKSASQEYVSGHMWSGQMAHLFSVVGSLFVEWEAHCWTPTSPCCSVGCWRAFEGGDCLKPPGLGLGHCWLNETYSNTGI